MQSTGFFKSFKEWLNGAKTIIHKKDVEFTAEYAWLETTYGDGSFKTLDERIKDKQDEIKSLIRSKFPYRGTNYPQSQRNGSYRCVVDIEEDLVGQIDVIFQPFIKSGFAVINLSDCVSEIDDENLYLISWKKTFSKTKKNKSK